MLKQSLSLIPNRRDHFQAKLVFAAFIASLTMFFLAGLASYIIIRQQAFIPIQQSYQSLRLPPILWASTGLLIINSIFLERACWFVRRQLLEQFQQNLKYAALISGLFLVLQAKGMADLLMVHFSMFDGSTKIYGMSFTLAFIHALHVIGGMAFLGYVIVGAQRQRYDHERHWAVNHCAGYWHFLDIVWIAMLLTFTISA